MSVLTALLTGKLHDLQVKEAESRQLKELRKLHAAGDIRGVERLAGKLHAAGMMKETPAGSQVNKSYAKSRLGRGAEGVAVEVFGPHGVEVRKQFDPQSVLASRALREDKAKFFQAAQQIPDVAPHVAKIYGAHEAPNFAIHRMERVYGKDISREFKYMQGLHDYHRDKIQYNDNLDRIKSKLDRAASHAGLGGHRDAITTNQVNPGNVFKTPGGRMKVIDILPLGDLHAPRKTTLPAGNKPAIPGMQEYFPDGVDQDKLRPGASLTSDKDLLRELGSGSRQAKKVPGAKPVEPARFASKVNPDAYRSSSWQAVNPGAPYNPPKPGFSARYPRASKGLMLAGGVAGLAGLGYLGYQGYNAYKNRATAQDAEPVPAPVG